MAFLGCAITLLLLVRPSKSGNICYFPDGDTSRDVPCDSDAPFTQCCASRSACLTNGLCVGRATSDTGISYIRGTCTDRSWASPLCPQQCQLNQDTPTNSSAYDFRTDGVQVWQCGAQGYGRESQFCCESEAEKQRCCETETAVFVLGSATLGPSTVVASSTSTSSSAATSILTSPTSSTPSETRATDTATAIPPATDRTGSRSSNNATIIGASVGGAVGGCILVALLVLFIRRHKSRAIPYVNEVNEPYSAPAETECKPRHELMAERQHTELPSHDQPVWELPVER